MGIKYLPLVITYLYYPWCQTGGFCDQTVSNRGDYVIIPGTARQVCPHLALLLSSEGVNSGIDGTQGCLLQDANGPVASNFVSR